MTITRSEMKELFHECGEMNCMKPATHVVYWPGRVPPPVYCHWHALKAVAILDLMGCPVKYEEIKENGKES